MMMVVLCPYPALDTSFQGNPQLSVFTKEVSPSSGEREMKKKSRTKTMLPRIEPSLGRRLMHHQNVSLQNAPSKRTLLTSLKRGQKQDHPSLKGQKKYVLMVQFAVIRFDGASGACQFSFVAKSMTQHRTDVDSLDLMTCLYLQRGTNDGRLVVHPA